MADELEAYDKGWAEGMNGKTRRKQFGDNNLNEHYQEGYKDGAIYRDIKETMKKFPQPPQPIDVKEEYL